MALLFFVVIVLSRLLLWIVTLHCLSALQQSPIPHNTHIEDLCTSMLIFPSSLLHVSFPRVHVFWNVILSPLPFLCSALLWLLKVKCLNRSIHLSDLKQPASIIAAVSSFRVPDVNFPSVFHPPPPTPPPKLVSVGMSPPLPSSCVCVRLEHWSWCQIRRVRFVTLTASRVWHKVRSGKEMTNAFLCFVINSVNHFACSVEHNAL